LPKSIRCHAYRDRNHAAIGVYMAFSGFKSPFSSLTILGAFLSLVAGLEELQHALEVLPIELFPPRGQAAITSALAIVGAVLAIVGRFKAKQKITFKKP